MRWRCCNCGRRRAVSPRPPIERERRVPRCIDGSRRARRTGKTAFARKLGGRGDWKAADEALSMLQCIVREDLRELCHLRSRWSSQLLAVEVGNRSGVDVHGPCDGVDTVAGEAALSVSTSASDNIPAPLGKRAGGWRRLKRPRRRSSWLRAAARCWCSRRSTRSRWVQEITSAKIQARDANQVLRVAGVVATRVGCRVHQMH